jgi:nucleoid DNA-binding protein
MSTEPGMSAPKAESAAPRRRRKRFVPSDVVLDDKLSVRIFGEVRDNLLRGEAVVLPGLGRFEVHRRKAYLLTHPSGARSRRIEAECKVVYQPDRSLLRMLNGEEDPSEESNS